MTMSCIYVSYMSERRVIRSVNHDEECGGDGASAARSRSGRALRGPVSDTVEKVQQ